ncbi:hypothetical protein NL676_026652 [Syzygium grande]|nr:hypothetical protein NL676_026652 [Syzygium grande]
MSNRDDTSSRHVSNHAKLGRPAATSTEHVGATSPIDAGASKTRHPSREPAYGPTTGTAAIPEVVSTLLPAVAGQTGKTRKTRVMHCMRSAARRKEGKDSMTFRPLAMRVAYNNTSTSPSYELVTQLVHFREAKDFPRLHSTFFLFLKRAGK